METLIPGRLGTGYRWLLGSSWTTNLSDGIALAAGPLLVASVTSDPFLISMAALLTWAPPLLFGLFAGVLADRVDRRLLLIVSNVVRAVVLAGMAAAVLTDRASAGAVLLMLGLLATAEVFADNTASTLLPMLVHRDDLGIANARLQTGIITLNQLAGPAIGAALFAAGRSTPFVTQAVLVAAGTLLLVKISLPPHGREPQPGSSVRRDIAQGLAWTWRHPAVRALALLILVFNVTFGAAWAVLVLYSIQRLNLGAVGFGLLTTISATGGLLGTALYGWITRRVSLGNIMRVGLVIETFTHLGLALTTSPWVAGGIMFLFGAHAFIWSTTAVTVRQRAVPTDFQGRVGGVYLICVYGGLVVGSGIGGVLATHYGVTAPFWFAFAGSALFVVLLWREMTRIAHQDQPHPA